MYHAPFYIQDNNGDCLIRYATGENPAMKPSEARNLLPIILNYICDHTDEEIEAFNVENKERFINSWREAATQNVTEKAKMSGKGYIYLFKCADKYKVGYSKNVRRRLKELDKRPFPLEVISEIKNDNAFEIEQTIHILLREFKIQGEWYDFESFVPTEEWFKGLIGKCERYIKEKKV